MMDSEARSRSMERFICSSEPDNRSQSLMRDSAMRLKLTNTELEQIEKPYTFFYQRLPVDIDGMVFNISSGIVLHNRARGPFKGGIRIAPDVNIWETTELSRLMTLKTSLAGLELGGGKSGIRLDTIKIYNLVKDRFNLDYHEFTDMLKGLVMREFVDHFVERGLVGSYIPAPDMGSSSREMMYFYNRTHIPSSVTAKPEGVEGWLSGRHEATGFGTAYATKLYLEKKGVDLHNITVAIQGFGNVGSHAAYYLKRYGCKVIAVTDQFGGVHQEEGINVEELMEYARKHRSVEGYDKERSITNEELFRLPVDVLVPAAMGHVIDVNNCDELGVRLCIPEAANMPVSYDAFLKLEARGIEVLPDNFVNSGGVIASDLEYKQGIGGIRFTRQQVFEHLEMKFDEMFSAMVDREKAAGSLTQAACDIAVERIYNAMRTRYLI